MACVRSPFDSIRRSDSIRRCDLDPTSDFYATLAADPSLAARFAATSVAAIRRRAGPIRKMQVNAMELLVIVALVLIFEFAAARWGYDSRDLFRLRDD